MTDQLKTVCAWCPPADEPPDPDVSHGICAGCRARMEAEFAEVRITLCDLTAKLVPSSAKRWDQEVAACGARLGCTPGDIRFADRTVPLDFGRIWLEVARRDGR